MRIRCIGFRYMQRIHNFGTGTFTKLVFSTRTTTRTANLTLVLALTPKHKKIYRYGQAPKYKLVRVSLCLRGLITELEEYLLPKGSSMGKCMIYNSRQLPVRENRNPHILVRWPPPSRFKSKILFWAIGLGSKNRLWLTVPLRFKKVWLYRHNVLK